MITANMTVTIEAVWPHPLACQMGRRGVVMKIVGCFAIVKMEDGNVYGCEVDYIQPVMTAAMFTASRARSKT